MVKFIFRFTLVLLFFSGTSIKLWSQQTHKFNSLGSSCYFEYICFAANNDYDSRNRPFIFILGEESTSAFDAWTHDSLKNKPTFWHYFITYMPNRGGSASEKLNCVDALASLLTSGFINGRNNVFLFIGDTSINEADIKASGLSSIFNNIRLTHVNKTNNVESSQVEDDFNENRTYYHEDEVVEEEYGTFYVEENSNNNSNNNNADRTIAKKVYFGPPAKFDYTITGIVRDVATGETLPYATIFVKGTSIGVSTNADGFFTILKVPCDTNVLVVQYVGYDKSETYLTPQTQQRNLIISLRSSQFNLKTVSIFGSRDELVLANKNDVSIIKLTPKKLDQLPGIGEKDIMRSFQLMPGISASNESSSGLYVRGGTPDQNLVLYDGFTVYHVDHLYGFFSAFNANAVKDVQLYKGGFESRFGGRLSSVTEITGKDGNQKRFNMGVDLSLLSINGFVEVPFGTKFSSIITYRRSYKGALYNLIFDKFNKNDNTTDEPIAGPGGTRTQETKVTSYFYDLNGKFTYRPTTRDVVSLSFFNGTDKLDNSSSMNAPMFGSSNSGFSMSSTDLTNYGNIGSSLRWSRKWTDKFYGNNVLSYSNYYSDRDRSQERLSVSSDDDTTTTNNGIFENNNLRDFSFRSENQWDIFHFSQLQFGFFGTYYDIQYSYAQNDTSTVLDKHNQALLTGGYLQTKLQFFGDKLLILPGVRASWFETTNKLYYEPRASLSLSLTKRISLKAATGRYYQFANRVTREDIMSGSKDFWLLSDGNNIPVSSADHYIAGLVFENNSILLSAEAYYKKLNNITEYSLRFNPSPVGVSYNENFFSGQGYSRGIEFLAQRKSGKLNGWVSYTLGESRSQFDVYSDKYFAANQDVTHEFKMVFLYSKKRWDFSLTWIYATGRPYTSPSGAYTITLLDGTTQDFYTVTDKNMLRLPDYHRCDIAATYKLLKGVKSDTKRREIGNLGFSVFNLYNHKNVWYKQFTIEDGGIIETNVNYLGFTPNIILSLKLW
ncbi:MAG: TonB-dependent receptor [Bacteroidetes bacterium HGW-Bacteroidetes-6]|jgi:hypothetical protein|nr:MAG: TonB-dependent receptor [Bacteroidetes bacterium HGW-Bacteroidetes-6]